MKKMVATLSLLAVTTLFGTTDPVGNLVVRQRWPFSRLVDISFTLSGLSDAVDVDITLSNGSRTYVIPDEAVSGDSLFSLTNGTYRYVFNPELCAAGGTELLTAAKFKVTAREIPLYMIVNLDPAFVGERISYLTKSDIKSGAYGGWTEDYSDYLLQDRHAAWDRFIWTGMTNDLCYTVTNMVFRRIPAGSMKMNWNNVSDSYISKPCYVSVFEFTRGYATMLRPDLAYSRSAVSLSKPVYNIGYSSVRGSTNETDGVDWPSTGHEKVSADSWIGRLRSRTGGRILFDLPTRAQALYAYMGGCYNFGTYFTGQSGSDDVAKRLGRYAGNGGLGAEGKWNGTVFDNMEDPDVGFAPAGRYMPNGFGLYDVAGNVCEMTLDYYSGGWDSDYLIKKTDPVGATYLESLAIAAAKSNQNGGKRSLVGGSAMNDAANIVQTASGCIKNDEYSSIAGFRVYAPVTRAMYAK